MQHVREEDDLKCNMLEKKTTLNIKMLEEDGRLEVSTWQNQIVPLRLDTFKVNVPTIVNSAHRTIFFVKDDYCFPNGS